MADTKKKSTAVAKTASNTSKSKKASAPASRVPIRLVLGLISLALACIHIVVVLQPQGTLPLLYKNLILGLLGEVGFWMLLVLFPFLVWSLIICRRGNVVMRSIAAIGFCLVCATSYHLFFPERTYEGVFSAIGQLFAAGKAGSGAGVIGGAIAMLLRGILGGVLSFVVLLILAAILLLRSMEITLMGLYNAFLNRPRYEEEKEPEEVRDNAQELVNHLARKRMERRQRQNQRKLEEEYEYYEEGEDENTPDFFRQDMNHIFSSRRDEKPRQEVVSAPIIAAPDEAKQEKLMRQIQEETDVPVVAHAASETEDIMDISQPEETPEVVNSMPELKIRPTKPAKKQPDTSAQEVAKALDQAVEAVKAPYCFPPINLLRMPPRNGVNGTEEMKENSRRLNETLESFNIAAHIVNVTRGPSVTRYEVELEKGVKLSKLTNCADDIALSLGASGVRIAAVPGKISVVGIEVPNRAVTMVSLREVIDSNEFNSSKGKSTFAVGKDIGGSCIIGNIAKMPHMLIAGTTGSGKSVCMNSIIISLLYKAGPEDVKLIMVDPKMVELANYNGIPHLMIPVVTDPKKAAGALQWAVTEMMRRYKTMSDAGVRDLESYNTIVEAEGGQKVPQLVVIIDELADLMMVAAKEVEDSICRIAQMGRASGVHLVIATQRPSADVITGLMKANIPSRIAFSVASAMESRIILDTQGAEKLVGKGDMLFAPIGAGKPHRVQGCFVSDAEVLAVTSYVKEHFVADYDQTVLADIEKKAQQTGKKSAPSTAFDPEPNMDELEGDELLPQAVDVVLETGQASVSMLQRRLKLGYARAARIVDEMEEKGIVGPFQGSKPRNILVTKEQWESMKASGFGQMSMDDLDDGAVPEDLPF